MLPLPRNDRSASRALRPEESGERVVPPNADALIARAAEACARGALSEAADAYRDAAAIEARTGDLERALACLRMSTSLRVEIVHAERRASA